MGLFDDNNRVLRQEMEDQLAQELKEEGYNAVISGLTDVGEDISNGFLSTFGSGSDFQNFGMSMIDVFNSIGDAFVSVGG